MEKKETTFRQILESDAYAAQREILREDINSNPMVIDRSCFHLTDEQRGELETAKFHWRVMIQKKGYTKRNVPYSMKTKKVNQEELIN